MTVYLLPGVGCDHRLYDRLELPVGHRVVKLDWPEFEEVDTLAAIAKRLCPLVDATEPHVLVGVSMGGMVAQELAALTRPTKVVLISSWTGPQEWTPFIRLSAQLRLNTLIRDWTMRAVWPLKKLIDRREDQVDGLLWDMARLQTARQLRYGTAAILRWQGSPWQGPLVRIHGDKDIVTPLRFPVDHLVKGGQHVMVLTRPQEVGRLLAEAVNA